jgi:ParB family chromosome partitioning protein
MTQPVEQKNWQERRLGRTILRTYRATLDIHDILPNTSQPRMGPKEDPELQRQIEANEGVFEPLLVEPHPDLEGKFRIIDGDRRWTNSQVLVDSQKKNQFRAIPAEITDRTLTDDERIRVWVYIHRQRREWDAKEKEMVAYSLVDLLGRASAANILGITVSALDKLVEIYELSEKLGDLREPGSSITWAREIKNLSKKLLTPTVLDSIIKKINERKITNSKDIRQLRKILRDPVAKEEFLSERGEILTALEKLPPDAHKKRLGLSDEVAALVDTIKRHPWTALDQLRTDADLLRNLDEAEKVLEALKRQLTQR